MCNREAVASTVRFLANVFFLNILNVLDMILIIRIKKNYIKNKSVKKYLYKLLGIKERISYIFFNKIL